MTAASKFAGICLRHVLQSLQHSQPTIFYCSQLLSAQPKEFQSNQPAIFWRPSSMDLFANKHYTHPRAFANMLQHVCQSLQDTVFAPYVRYIRVWDRPHVTLPISQIIADWKQRYAADAVQKIAQFAVMFGSVVYSHQPHVT